jgi:hypothetical protein
MKITGSILFLILSISGCQSAPPHRGIRWNDKTLQSTGFGPVSDWSWQGRLIGIQQAKEDATRQLEEQMISLVTDSGETLLQKSKHDPKIKTKIKAYAKGANIVSIENRADGILLETTLFLGDHFEAILGLLPPKELSPSSSPAGSYRSAGPEGQF